jgi:hypothetical protein
MLVVPITEREFSLYALSLPRGPNFDLYLFHSGWKLQSAGAAGALLSDPDSSTFGFVAMRRRTDHCWVLKGQKFGLSSEDSALAMLTAEMGEDGKPEPLPPGKKRRPSIIPKATQPTSEIFKLLTQTITHRPALMAVGEVYFAMPNPDDNFARDLQTENFDSRIFELYLLACFREQGVFVAQDHVSPDFFIERNGHECNVEAVTANAKDRTPKTALTTPTFAPTSREERLTGAPAVRFAKTLRSKLQREYETLPHVAGKPFALAIADFHAPSSMVWSREALPSYLFGVKADVDKGPDRTRAIGTVIHKLLGEDEIPAGLFRDPFMAYLSGIIFSNAATIAKFNRMGYLAGWQPGGLRMVRQGILFDRTPGALEPIDFSFDILSEEYMALWPGGEAWCQELEVFHNPLAEHPIAFDLLPGATHWFESEGEIICSTMWENSVIASVTTLQIPKRKQPEAE